MTEFPDLRIFTAWDGFDTHVVPLTKTFIQSTSLKMYQIITSFYAKYSKKFCLSEYVCLI